MVDQRRRSRKEAEQQPREYLRQVSSQLALEAAAWKELHQDGDLMNTSSMDSGPSLDEDLLVNTSGVLGLDPGNDALLFGQCSGSWGFADFDVEPKAGPACSFMDKFLEEGYPLEGGTIPTGRDACKYMEGVYPPGQDAFFTSPFAVPPDLMYGVPLEECKPEFKHPMAEQSMSGISFDVKPEPLEAPAVESFPRGQAFHGGFLGRDQRSEMRETRKVPLQVDLSMLHANQISQRGPGRSKGVTMCLRTLLRQLLAGTGWIMDSSISKDQATNLIRQLVGPKLDSLLVIQLSPRRAEIMSSEDKEAHYSRILGQLVTQYVGHSISHHEAQELIKRDKGPYHLTQEFIDMLNGKEWPPQMIPEKELRKYGCYRQGEASKRGRHD